MGPFLAGKGGGVSEDSSWTVLPFLAGSKGGMSQYSTSLLSLESNVNEITMNVNEICVHEKIKALSIVCFHTSQDLIAFDIGRMHS